MKYIITEEQFSTIQTNNPGSILRMVKKIYNSMNMEGVCEMDLGYDEEDNNFHCYSNYYSLVVVEVLSFDYSILNILLYDLLKICIERFVI